MAAAIVGEDAEAVIGKDEWHVRLFGMDVDGTSDDAAFATHNARHTAIEALLWDAATRVLMLGVDVILDFGFWTRRERDTFRARARELGVGFNIHFAAASEKLLLERIAARNNQLPPGTFHIPEARLKEWICLFEAPSPEELAE